MTIRVGINGFGRIGRNFYRASIGDPAIEVVAVNDGGTMDKIAHLLKYDSVHGRLRSTITPGDRSLTVDDKTFAVMSNRDPRQLSWDDHGVDVVIESTGAFRDRESAGAHLERGAQKVIITAPADCDVTIVPAVNGTQYRPDDHDVISAASCTTNCLVTMLHALQQGFGIRSGMLTTVHAYTGDQAIVDGSHLDLRRGRAAAVNMVPTTTGAARAVGQVLPELDGRLDGVAMRVPIINGSICDFVGVLDAEASASDVNECLRDAATTGPLSEVLEYSEEPLVSSDIIGSPASCTIDSELTTSYGGMVKVLGWYDNEWGYSCRVLDLVHLVMGDAEPDVGTTKQLAETAP